MTVTGLSIGTMGYVYDSTSGTTTITRADSLSATITVVDEMLIANTDD